MLSIYLAVIISLGLFGAAYFFQRTALEIFDEGDTMCNFLAVFLLIYGVVAVGMYVVLPRPGGARLSAFYELTDPARASSLLTRGEGQIIELP